MTVESNFVIAKARHTDWLKDVLLVFQPIRFFHQSHNTVLFGGLFTLKQWIISSLKHDTVPRVNKLYCFYVKNPQNVLHYGIVKTVNEVPNVILHVI